MPDTVSTATPATPRPFLFALIFSLLVPALVGAMTGACVGGISRLVEERSLSLLASLPGFWPALFAPLALLGPYWINRWITRTSKPSTSELYIETYHRPGGEIPLRQVPGRLLAAAATVCSGGSQGFESASALIGSSWSKLASRARAWLLTDDERKTLMAAGASAGISAVFSSPVVGAVYGIEVPYRRDIDFPRWIPCTVAAFTSFWVRDRLVGSQSVVTVLGIPEITPRFLLAVLAVAVLCGLGARVFAWVEDKSRLIGQEHTPLQRAVFSGVVLSLVSLAAWSLSGGTWITFGPGYIAADWLTSQAAAIPLGVLAVLMLLRASGTLLCVYGGGGGGVFTSLACIGVFIGEIVGHAAGCQHTRMLALFGAACFLASGYRLPVACMFLVAGETGDIHMTILGIGAVIIGQLLMRGRSVSNAQRDHR